MNGADTGRSPRADGGENELGGGEKQVGGENELGGGENEAAGGASAGEQAAGRAPPRTVRVDDVAPVEVGPGCLCRDLPSAGGVRAWVVDLAPGCRWPHVDEHEAGEGVYVVAGELIEGERRFGPGTYVAFAPGSSHRPRTERGVRLFGFNPTAAPSR